MDSAYRVVRDGGAFFMDAAFVSRPPNRASVKNAPPFQIHGTDAAVAFFKRPTAA
jgi:hypothetical protein